MNQVQLDSLYDKFIQLRAPELLPPTDQPVVLTLEDRKCGFGIVNSIKSNIGRFSPEQQNILKTFFARPVLPNSIVSPSGFFRIHYDASGINRPSFVSTWSVEQNVAEVANALDSVYRFVVTYLGFLAPPSDGTGGSDDKYDVYIQNQGGGIYGYTEWESKVGAINWTSFMVIDNDYVGYYSTGLNGMKVTVAHEFHHGIQLGNYSILNGTSPYRNADAFFYELTSTSMEEFVYDTINDYYAYMHSYFVNPEGAMPNQNGYNLAIWNIFLQKRFGFDIIKQQWELIPSINAIMAINNTILNVGSSFPGELNKFGIWTYYTNFRTIPGSYFEEAANYPLISPTFIIPYPSPPPGNLSSKPTANNFLLFNVSSNSDSLVTIITNGDALAALNNPNQSFSYDYILYADPKSGQRELTANYSSTFSASNPSFWSVSEILNGLLVREDSTIIPGFNIAESFAFPNPFRYSGNLSVSIDGKQGEPIDFNVYSSDMSLMYSSQEPATILINNTVGISWNGLDKEDKKLSSGVYIYVIKQGDEVVKGKVVIFNE